MKMPALQFYPADWRKDPSVQALGYFDRGVWFEMLCLMHESSERGVLLLNGSPMPEAALARILGLDNQNLTTTLTTLLTYGVAKRRESDGAIFSKRMVEDEKLCQVRRAAGKLGGNPILVKQNSTTGVKQIPTPSSSSSSSTSKTSKALSDYSDDFIQFWNAYPPRRKTAKAKCYAVWKRTKANIDTVMAALAWQKEMPDWVKDGGEYIPAPLTYLNQKLWLDDKVDAEAVAGLKEPPWYISSTKIELKAREAGIEQGRDEQWHLFRNRVYEACGITPEMVRKATADWSVKK